VIAAEQAYSTHSVKQWSNEARFRALDMDLVGRGWAGKGLGKYDELCYLADKVARFLYEFHAADYLALVLPAIPSTASSGAIHKLLKTEKVCRYMLLLSVNSKIV
jgi:hypothetical protein